MRYAVYYTPHQQHPLSACVETWLGRNAFTDDAVDTSHGLDHFLDSPRKYGFHGTLKAPFHLADGVHEEELVELFDCFAASHLTFTMDKMELVRLGTFFALVPAEQPKALVTLAEDVVRTFEPMRAPLSETDIQRRNPDKLSTRQRENLMRWGYPYVFEDFNFHLTLTSSIEESDQETMETAIRAHFSDFLNKPLVVTTLGLFVERERGSPFTVKRIATLS